MDTRQPNTAAYAAGGVIIAGLVMIAVGAFALVGAASAQTAPAERSYYIPNMDTVAACGIYGCASGIIGAALVLAGAVALHRIFRRPRGSPGFPVQVLPATRRADPAS